MLGLSSQMVRSGNFRPIAKYYTLFQCLRLIKWIKAGRFFGISIICIVSQRGESGESNLQL